MLVGAAATAMLTLCILQLTLPGAASSVAYCTANAISVSAVIVGLRLRKPRIRAPFRWLAAAGMLSLASGLLHLARPDLGPPWNSADPLSIAGYLCLPVFLIGFVRTTARRGLDDLALRDAAMMSAAGALVLWSGEIAPTLFMMDAEPATVLLVSLYPLVDIVIVALAVRLVFQVGWRLPATRLLLGAVALLLVGDGLAGILRVSPNGPEGHGIRLIYMVANMLFAVLALHPSMVRLAGGTAGNAVENTSDSPPRRSSAGRRTALVLAVLAPGVMAQLAPTFAGPDRLIRALILAVLLWLVARRLVGTVTALGRAEEATRHQSLHDQLTGLPNRAAFLSELEERLTNDPAEHWVTVAWLDADRFKQVNNTWGHPAGDEVLCAVAERLRALVPDVTRVYRTGGDEFAVLSSGPDADEGLTLARGLQTAVGDPLPLSGRRFVEITLTIGVARAHPGTTSATDLVRNADTALYRAKAGAPSGLAVFDDSLRAEVYDRLILAEDLRRAVREGEITPHFQPIHGGEGYADLIGFEALARWTHPKRGMVPPDQFIPLAEDNGSILEIGESIMRRACFELAGWRARTGLDLHVSVNVSPVQIVRDGLVAMVESALSETALPPDALWLEITESLLMERSGPVRATLAALKDLGVVIALDDFGTGFSSLSCIGDFPIDVVKVDRSFVKRLGEDPRTTELTRLIIDMATSLRLHGVVAEGVETAEQAQIMASMNCTWLQGWWCGRPMAPADVVLPEVGPLTARSSAVERR
ncbi:MAG: bifunctional diguanylate cyclase/phosphodiesterase [Actinomycetales bacterium]|nr:bifunctional diguanylate cyclase/phosphodiesterase [Actinomycetales bacterium]